MIYIPEDHIEKYLKKYGEDVDKQIGILQEECAELIVALSKYKRYGINKENKKVFIDNITEELTHVAISSNIVAKLLNIEDYDVLREVKNKDERFKVV